MKRGIFVLQTNMFW